MGYFISQDEFKEQYYNRKYTPLLKIIKDYYEK